MEGALGTPAVLESEAGVPNFCGPYEEASPPVGRTLEAGFMRAGGLVSLPLAA